MIPYYLLNRNRRNYERLAQDLNNYSRINTHMQDRPAANQSSLSVSDMISSGTLHAVNSVEKGWNSLSSLFRG
jgi:hypothetical protein